MADDALSADAWRAIVVEYADAHDAGRSYDDWKGLHMLLSKAPPSYAEYRESFRVAHCIVFNTWCHTCGDDEFTAWLGTFARAVRDATELPPPFDGDCCKAVSSCPRKRMSPDAWRAMVVRYADAVDADAEKGTWTRQWKHVYLDLQFYPPEYAPYGASFARAAGIVFNTMCDACLDATFTAWIRTFVRAVRGGTELPPPFPLTCCSNGSEH